MAELSTPSRRRVVITGIGPVTPIGIGKDAFWQGLAQGKSGAAEITLIEHADFPVHFACEVKDFRPGDWMDRHQARRLDRNAHLALAAAQLAIGDAGLLASDPDKSRVGVVFTSGVGGIGTYEEQIRRMTREGPRGAEPHLITSLMPNCAAAVIAMRFGFTGLSYGTVSACASSAHAIAAALRHIQCGDADAVLVGGTEASITLGAVAGFAKIGALSRRHDAPARASRPFDKDRDGFVLGEGATALVAESRDHALARHAPIYAEILGVGMTTDAHNLIEPDPEARGIVRCMERPCGTPGSLPPTSTTSTPTAPPPR